MKWATLAGGPLIVLFSSCYASTPIVDEPVGCHFSLEDDSGNPPYECVVPARSEETCLDAGRCVCRAMNPGGTDEEIDECIVMEVMPRAMITLSDYCGPWSSMTLSEALSAWAAARGELIVTDPACDDMQATLDWM